MLFKTINAKNSNSNFPWLVKYIPVGWSLAIALLIILFFAPQAGYTKDKQNHSNSLPPAPNTGSPEEDFAAGGSREGNSLENALCGQKNSKIVYLLGNKNREFTTSAHPSFWFYIPQNFNTIDQMKFVVTELATGKKVYEHILQKPQKSGVIGVNLPQTPKYVLLPKTNYTWSLQVDCAGGKQESITALTGWISRLPSNSELQNQLASTGETGKYKVYLQHNLLYDALTDLAQLRMAKPNNPNVEIAWTDLLNKLGWQDLTQPKSAVYRSVVEMKISKNNH